MWLNIYLLGIVSLLTDISSEMINAVMPAFLFALGGGGLTLGLVGNLPDVFQGLTHFFSGSLSDKIGRRKPLILAGYLISSVSKIFIAATNAIPVITAARAGDRIGKGVRTAPRDSLIGETIPGEYTGKAFGIHRMMDTTGAAVGTVMAFVLWKAGFGIKSIILTGSAVAFLALAPILILREKKIRIKPGEGDTKKGKLSPVLIYTAIFSVGNLSYLFFITFIQMMNKTGDRSSVSAGIISYIIYNLFYALFAVPAGKFADRTNCKKGMLLGNYLFLTLCVIFVFIKNPLYLMLAMAVFGISHAFIEVNQRTWVSLLSPDSKRGKTMGSFQLIRTLTLLAGGIIQGVLWNISPVYAFVWAGSLSAVSALFLTALPV
ncbi:MAG: MFS transporter [bacterium]